MEIEHQFRGRDFSSAANELLAEALKIRRCPGIVFADGPTGSRPMNYFLDASFPLSDPRHPVAHGTVAIEGQPFGQSVLLKGVQVFVGTATGTVIVSLADVTAPRVIGTIATV